MNSAPLPEFQLKKCLNYLTASAAHSGHTSYFLPLYRYSIRHLQSWRCSVEQQNFPSCNIHTTYLSHQFENLSLFGPFNVFLLELELMLFSFLSRSAHRTQTRLAESWAKHRVYIICQSLLSTACEPNKQDQEEEERREVKWQVKVMQQKSVRAVGPEQRLPEP